MTKTINLTEGTVNGVRVVEVRDEEAVIACGGKDNTCGNTKAFPLEVAQELVDAGVPYGCHHHQEEIEAKAMSAAMEKEKEKEADTDEPKTPEAEEGNSQEPEADNSADGSDDKEDNFDNPVIELDGKLPKLSNYAVERDGAYVTLFSYPGEDHCVIFNSRASEIGLSRVASKIDKIDGQPMAYMPINAGDWEQVFTRDHGWGKYSSYTIQVRESKGYVVALTHESAHAKKEAAAGKEDNKSIDSKPKAKKDDKPEAPAEKPAKEKKTPKKKKSATDYIIEHANNLRPHARRLATMGEIEGVLDGIVDSLNEEGGTVENVGSLIAVSAVGIERKYQQSVDTTDVAIAVHKIMEADKPLGVENFAAECQLAEALPNPLKKKYIEDFKSESFVQKLKRWISTCWRKFVEMIKWLFGIVTDFFTGIVDRFRK